MPVDLSQKLSENFSLKELVRSDTAERDPALLAAQRNPPDEVVTGLRHLCANILQPIRTKLGQPIHVTSGYRSPAVNSAVRGSTTSQHVKGQAADCVLESSFLTRDSTAAIRKEIEDGVLERTGRAIRDDVNANFYLFAYICLHLDELDVDQVIHEYGDGPGEPAWVHVSASSARDKREVLRLANGLTREQRHPSLEEALMFGTTDAGPAPVAAGAAGGEIVAGANAGEFAVSSGQEVLIRVTALRMGQFETVSSNAARDVGAVGPGNVYRITPQGTSGDLVHVVIDCNFPQRYEPTGEYQFSVQAAGGTVAHGAPPIFQPFTGTFPQSATRTITLGIV